jgi:hypothetical protein
MKKKVSSASLAKSQLHYDKCHDLGKKAIFLGGNIDALVADFGLEFKPGKDKTHFKPAIERAVRKGHGRLESELMEVAMALQRLTNIKKET